MAPGDGEAQDGVDISHLVGLMGLPPEEQSLGVRFYTVPIELSHEVQRVGEALIQRLERLLASEDIVPPDVVEEYQV